MQQRQTDTSVLFYEVRMSLRCTLKILACAGLVNALNNCLIPSRPVNYRAYPFDLAFNQTDEGQYFQREVIFQCTL